MKFYFIDHLKTKFIIIFLMVNFVGFSQTNIKISNSTYLKLSNGSQLIIDNPSTNPINKIGVFGGIETPSENEKVVINVSSLTGTFSVPFVSSVGNTIPFIYSITNSGVGSGKIEFSTYETSNNNLPLPTGVLNVNSNSVDNSSQVIDRFWIINPVNYTTKPKGVYTFTYDDNDLVGNTISESNLFAQRWNDVNNTWGDWFNSPVANTTTNTITVNIQSSSEQFKVWTAVDNGSPLPVELIDFKINCDDNILRWTTATEINNQYFIVQGSDNAVNFCDIDTLDGYGNSNQIRNYNFDVKESNYSYYRLKQVDYDGHYELSHIISGCDKVSGNEIVLYPNPNNGYFFINHNSTYLFTLYDIFGRLIWSEKSSRINFDFYDLSSGQYLLNITNSGSTIKTFKIIKTN